MSFDGIVRNIQAWVGEAVMQEHELRTPYGGGTGLLLGTLIFGDYYKRFLKYCVRSLLAEGNLRALGDKPTLFIHTDEVTLPHLAKGLMSMRGVADVFLVPVAKDIAKLCKQNSAYRYLLLGASEMVHTKRAYFRGKHFHCLFPDVVYPTGYFRNLERLILQGHRVVLSHSINASLEDVRGILTGGESPGRLTQIALKHMHVRQRHYVMNERDYDFVPPTPHLVYVERDRVTIAGMHANVALFHNEIMATPPIRINSTLDAQLPYMIPEGTPLYMPQMEDGLTVVELSDRKWLDYVRREGTTLHEFALRFWALSSGERGYEDCLAMNCEFPLEGSPPFEPLTRKAVEMNLARIRSYVAEIHPEVLRAFEMGGIIEENGINGPLQLPQDRLKEAILASRTAA